MKPPTLSSSLKSCCASFPSHRYYHTYSKGCELFLRQVQTECAAQIPNECQQSRRTQDARITPGFRNYLPGRIPTTEGQNHEKLLTYAHRLHHESDKKTAEEQTDTVRRTDSAACGRLHLSFFRQEVLFLSWISPDTLASVRISVPNMRTACSCTCFCTAFPTDYGMRHC